MALKRYLETIQSPPAQPGFLGNGHTARAVINRNFKDTDPFILLMDDMLDKQDGEPAGGPHPHAGFETVTLLLEGELGNGQHKMKAGDLQLMTAGSGVVHTETIDTKLNMRLLQLWLTLPAKERWVQPRVQDIGADRVPVATGNGWQARVYSGTLAGVTSPLENYSKVIIADVTLKAGTDWTTVIPAHYSTFIYVLDATLNVANDQKQLQKDQVGWLNRFDEKANSELYVRAPEADARFVLYAGEPQGVPIVSHGPFIADSEDKIRQLYREYREGKMNHILEVPKEQQLVW
jgi:hypothetical protein